MDAAPDEVAAARRSARRLGAMLWLVVVAIVAAAFAFRLYHVHVRR